MSFGEKEKLEKNRGTIQLKYPVLLVYGAA
jgi:hypothetical protein